MHRAGAAMLLIDLRENGTSDGAGRGTGLGMREADDIDTAVAGLKARGFETVGVVGCSLGGSAAIIAASRNPQIDAVVADSAMTSMKAFVADLARGRLRSAARWVPEGAIGAWGDLVIWISRLRAGVPEMVDAGRAVGEIAPRPLLLIHGVRDGAVNSWHAEALLAGSRVPDALWRVPDAGHCGALSTDKEAYAARVVALLEAAASREQAQAETSAPERSQ
jgi:pimeloyl-ACP methyl ester carboxylesterase